MKARGPLELLRDESVLLRDSAIMLLGQALIATAFVSGALVTIVLSYPVALEETRESVLLAQLEQFAPLLGVVLFPHMLALDLASGRGAVARASRSGIMAILARKMTHALVLLALTFLIVLLILRIFYTRFDLLPALGIVLPGALYLGCVAAFPTIATRRAPVGYAAGVAMMLIMILVPALEPLRLDSFRARSSLASYRFLGQENWLIAKIAFVVLALFLACIALRMSRMSRRWRLVAIAAVMLAIVHVVAHDIWTQPEPSRPAVAGPGRVLEAREQGDELHLITATTTLFWNGDEKHEQTELEQVGLTRHDGAWRREGESRFEICADIDLHHMDLEGSLEPASGELDLRAELLAIVHVAALQHLYLRVAAELQVRRVAVMGEELAFEKLGDLVHVTLSSPLPAGEVTIEIDYGGQLRLPARRRSEGYDDEYFSTSSRWHPHLKDWYHEGLRDLFTCSLQLTLPPGYRMAAGELTSDADYRTFEWRSDIAIDEIPLAVGRFDEVERRCGSVVITTDTFSVSLEDAQAALGRSAEVLKWLEHAFGPYPHRRLAIVEDRFQSAGGTGAPSIVRLKSERWRPEHRQQLLDGYLPHEIAHQWWGPGLPSWAAEGSAVYSNFYFLERRAGLAAAAAYLDATVYPRFLEDRAVPGALSTDQGASLYARAGYLLMVLSWQAGTETVLGALRDFQQLHRQREIADRDAVGAEILDRLRAVVAPDLHEFIQEWVRGTKNLDAAIEGVQQVQQDGKYTVTAQMAQRGELHFPVPLRLVTASGPIDEVWAGDTVEETLQFTLDRPVVSLMIDPEHILLERNRDNNSARPSSAMPSVASAPRVGRFAGWSSFSTADGLPTNDVRCVAALEGEIYAGLGLSRSANLAASRFANGKWQEIPHSGGSQYLVGSIARTPDGSLWFGGVSALARLHKGSLETRVLRDLRVAHGMTLGAARFEPNPRASSAIPGSRVQDLVTDAQGTLWIATDCGVTRLDPSTGAMRSFQRDDGLPGEEVMALATSSDGIVWAATDRGIASCEGESWQSYPQCGEELTLAVAVDEAGRVWMGTYRRGLGVFDGAAVRWYDAANSDLPHDLVVALELDDKQRLWIGTGVGLACLEGEHWRVLTTENSGLPSNQVRSLAWDDGGRLWIATDAGVTSFDPEVLSAPR
ncbi:MAG: two-component regulator propeller domain-containing protein [Planctomycetota bacterium]